MQYLNFARKYRPQSFAEVLGQDPIVQTLSNALTQDRIAQAYLFSGPRGSGKTSTARIFAKSLNCEKGPTAEPCQSCAICQEITQGRSLDVMEIDGASNRGIDQIRSLRELAQFAPASGKYKVYIIDEVHQITSEGFNALLKIVEEPPAHVIFVLATTELYKVPATILSRCQRYEFKRLGVELISQKLEGICKDEKIKIEPEAVARIALAAEGALRDAESILDQAVAFAQGKVTSDSVRELLGDIEEVIFESVLASVRNSDTSGVLQQVQEAVQSGIDLQQWTFGLVSYVRHLIAAKVGGEGLLAGFSAESLQALQEQSAQFSVGELTAIAQELSLCMEKIRWVTDPRIPLEMTLVRLSSQNGLSSLSDILVRLEALASGAPIPKSVGAASSPVLEAPPQPAPVAKPVPTKPEASQKVEPVAAPEPEVAPAPVSEPESQPEPEVEVKALSIETVKSQWPAFIQALQQNKASAAAYLTAGVPLSVGSEQPPQIQVAFPKAAEFQCKSLQRVDLSKDIDEIFVGCLGQAAHLSYGVVDPFPEDAVAQQTQVQETIASQPEASPASSGEASDVGDDFANSVADLFDGRVMPGGE